LPEKSLRLVLCDDHTVVRAGLSRILENTPGFEVIGEAATAEEAVMLAERERPDVVVMDVSVPEEGGISATKRILNRSPGTRVLVLTMHDDVAYLREAFAAGAVGYVLKEAAEAELVTAVQTVASGGHYVHPVLGAALLKAQPAGPADRAPMSRLSAREVELLQLLAQGYTNPEMAKELHLSVRTIESYRANLQQKLKLKSRAELVRFARDTGLLQ